MSNFLTQVNVANNLQTGIRVVVAGVEGVGKTSICCNAPKCLLVPLEVGFRPKQTPSVPMISTFEEVLDFLDEVIAACQKGKFAYKSIFFDSATALEKLIHNKVVRMDPQYSPGNKKTVTMDSALGGYGKAYDFSNSLFASFLEKCDLLVIHGGVNIIQSCHVFANELIDPSSGKYNSWDLLLHSPKNAKTYGKREMLMMWSDFVGFMYEPMFVSKENETFSKGISSNKGRVIGVERTPAYVAKNRFEMKGEISIPKDNSWNYLAQAIHTGCGLDVFNRETT